MHLLSRSQAQAAQAFAASGSVVPIRPSISSSAQPYAYWFDDSFVTISPVSQTLRCSHASHKSRCDHTDAVKAAALPLMEWTMMSWTYNRSYTLLLHCMQTAFVVVCTHWLLHVTMISVVLVTCNVGTPLRPAMVFVVLAVLCQP